VVRRPQGECRVEIVDLSGMTRTLRMGRGASIRTVKKGLADHWSIPVTCQKLFLSQPIDGVARLLDDDRERIVDLQEERSTENLQLTLVACVDGLLVDLNSIPAFDRDGDNEMRRNVFKELLMVAQWMPESEDRLLHRFMSAADTGTERRVVLLALARWAWKGDNAALDEFVWYVEHFLTPQLHERLNLLQLEFEPHAEGDDHVALLMAAALTVTAVSFDNGTRWSHWAEIIARMTPQGDLRAIRMLIVALQQPRAIVRQVAAKALNCLPWWNLQCTQTALVELTKAITHKSSRIRVAALHTLTSVMSIRHAATGSAALSKKCLSHRETIALHAALNHCLRDDTSLKVRHAASEASASWQDSLPREPSFRVPLKDWRPHHAEINGPLSPQLRKPLNNGHSSKERLPTKSCLVNAVSKLPSKGKEKEKHQDCTALEEEDNSMTWCEEYDALKADRRASITRSRLREGKTLQWRSNKHHRNPQIPHQELPWRKANSKGRRAIQVSRQPCARPTSLPRRAFACEIICLMDLDLGYKPIKDDDSFQCSGHRWYRDWCCFTDCGDPFEDLSCWVEWKFSDEYDWIKEDRCAKIAKSRLGRRVPKISKKVSCKNKMRAGQVVRTHKVSKVLFAAVESTLQAALRLSNKHAACKRVQWHQGQSDLNPDYDVQQGAWWSEPDSEPEPESRF